VGRTPRPGVAVSTYTRTEAVACVASLADSDRHRLLDRLAFAHPTVVMDVLAQMRADDRSRPNAAPTARLVAADAELRERGAL